MPSDASPNPEQNRPLDKERRIVQYHKKDVAYKGDFVEHFPHNIILNGKQADPQLAVNPTGAGLSVPAFLNLR